MVKSNHVAPLQIRLTEPVIFLRGPSTGTDFRGRPQQAPRDGQLAMVRGLLTLRLHKPTRIRNISISLEGRSRTEWPEGIGPRRTDTFEETPIISETTTFFSAADGIATKSTRRSHSLGPGAISQYDLDADDQDDYGFGDSHVEPDRGRPPPRSASVLPSNPDDWMSWHRDGYSRPPSPERGDRGAPSRQDSALSLSNLRNLERERGPSPAYSPTYTPLLSAISGSGLPRPSSLREVTSLVPQRDPLSPIASANVSSRGTSERDASTDTEARVRHPHGSHLAETALAEGVEWDPATTTPSGGHPEEPIVFAPVEDPGPPLNTAIRFQSPPQLPSAELEDAPEREQATQLPPQPSSPDAVTTPTPGAPLALHNSRAASLRTIDSAVSSNSGRSAQGVVSEYHPVSSASQPVPTAVSTPANETPPGGSSPYGRGSPAASGPPSVADGVEGSSHRRSSGLRPGSNPSAGPSPRTSGDIPEVIQGRTTPGSSSVIINHGAPHSPSPGSSEPPFASSNGSMTDERGRKPNHHHHHKFSIAAALRGLSQDVKDRVRSHSRPTSRPASRASSRTRAETPSNAPYHQDNSSVSIPMSQSSSSTAATTAHRAAVDDFHTYGRGGAGRRSRSVDKAGSSRSPAPSTVDDRGRSRHRMKALADVLGMAEDGNDHEEVHNWKEFRKGVYNYPISFSIPTGAPPSITCEFGSVVYKLKATVVRAGALTTNLTEDMDVTMIAGPQEDDMEETDNVIVERQWEEQMRYQIALSGKAFPIGGTIPMSIRLMPLMKCKIYRLTVALEEKSDYFAAGRKVARHETPRRFILFAAKNPDPHNKKERPEPLLPILSESMTAVKDSPLAELARNAALNNPREFAEFSNPEDDVYASLLDPLGPWHLEKDLHVPDCVTRIKFTTKHEHTNIAVAHWLKVTIRVERGDDAAVDSKGRRKQFDIIIETPIKILDCRVNPQYNSLPSYERVGVDLTALGNGCSIHAKTNNNGSSNVIPKNVLVGATQAGHIVHGILDSTLHHHSGPEQHTSSPLLSPEMALPGHSSAQAHAEHEDTLLERNIVYDRLMSGQETETGEEPPSYGEAVASAIRSARSASRIPHGSRSTSAAASTSQSRSNSRAPSVQASPSGSRSRSRARMYIED